MASTNSEHKQVSPWRVLQKSSRDSHMLLLASTQAHAPLPYLGIVTFWKRHDSVVHLRGLGGSLDFLMRRTKLKLSEKYSSFEVIQAIGIALESHRLDLILHIFKLNEDVSLLSYAMDVVLETNFSLSYRNQVLNFLLPLFPPLEPKSPHVHTVTRLLVTLSDATLTIPLLTALVPKETLLAYELAFD